MTNESTTFTATDLQGFLDEMVEHDRLALADRLQRASERLAEYGQLVTAADGQEGDVSTLKDSWSAHEVLAHIVVLSKFYGVVFHKVASGKMTELDLLTNVGLRDSMDEQMAQIEPKELLRMALEDHARTIKGLQAADAASMRRVVTVDGGETMTAEEVARLPLISHLELHIDQLARALA
jgi:DinB superfamily